MANIRVESDPPGAHIFYGVGSNEQLADSARSFIGTTPFIWQCKQKGDGTFDLSGSGSFIYSDFVKPAAVFTAEPPATSTNLYIQRQVFHAGAMFQPADKVPQGLFFDMHKQPTK